MPTVTTELEEAFGRLLSSAKGFPAAVASCRKQVRRALDPKTVLPPNCTSHVSLALTVLAGWTGDSQTQINGAIEDIKAAINAHAASGGRASSRANPRPLARCGC